MLVDLPVKIIEAKPAIRRQQLRGLVPLANTTIYEMEQRGEFPRRFYLTPRCPEWDLGESMFGSLRDAPPPALLSRRIRMCGGGSCDQCAVTR